MNYANLNYVLDQYIDQFEVLNGPINNETLKWKATKHFKEHWNIDDSSFAEMFKEAMAETSVLFDGSTISPVAGLKSLMKKEGEETFVKECFEELFVDDGGDLDDRLNRIDSFCSKINPRINNYWKGSFKYPQTRNSAIGYLSLWNSDDNYMYKYSLIRKWNLYMDISDGIGRGEKFSLAKYYYVCDYLKNIFLNENDNEEFESRRKKILELHDKRLEKIGYDLGKGYNLLVYDIVYCAYGYNFYQGLIPPTPPMPPRPPKQSKKVSEEDAKKIKEELNKQIADYEEELKELRNELKIQESVRLVWPDIVGAEIEHTTLGKGIITRIDRKNTEVSHLWVKFDGEPKKFLISDVGDHLILNHSEFNKYLEDKAALATTIADLKSDENIISIQINNLKSRLKKLK